MRLVFAAALLLSVGAAAQPARQGADPYAAASAYRDDLVLALRRTNSAQRAYLCRLRPWEWVTAIERGFRSGLDQRRDALGRQASDRQVYEDTVRRVESEVHSRFDGAVTGNSVSANVCLNLRTNTVLMEQLDAVAHFNGSPVRR